MTAAHLPPDHRAPSWAAPTATGPVSGTVRVPGSKSWTNRALILAAQATGPSVIRGALRSRDTDLMAAALRDLGVAVDTVADTEIDTGVDTGTGTGTGTDGTWRVEPAPLRGPARIDCGLAGTVMRFLPPLAATALGEIVFDGDTAARRRPMGTVLDALRALGASIDGDGLPFVLRGEGGLAGGTVHIDASASSQFVSGLLLSGASFAQGLTVVHAGPPVPSLPHVQMTVAALRAVGVRVDDATPDTWRVEPGPVAPWTGVIEPDLSNATPFLAAAAVTGGRVTVPGWPAHTTQAGDAIRDILAAMGARVERDGTDLTVVGPDRLRGVDLDLHDVGELTPTVLALALFADGPSHLHGIGHLRGHETDRLSALAGDAAALGGDVQEHPDALTVRPRPLHGGPWAAHADHRMATAGAIVGLRTAGVEVDDIDSTAKTLPGFDRMWRELLEAAR